MGSHVTLTFGLLSIACATNVAATSKAISFTRVTKEGYHRVKGKTFDEVTGAEISSEEMMKAFETSKGKNGKVVPLDDGDLASVQAAGDDNGFIEILEFVTANTLQAFEIEKTYFLAPDGGAEKAYALLSQVMLKKAVLAVGKWTASGKENVVMLRPHQEGDKIGLLMQPIFYPNEVKAFPGISKETARVSDAEFAMAEKLIKMLFTGEFDRLKYKDEFATRLKALVENKLAGIALEVVPARPAPPATTVDLMALLQASLENRSKP